MPAITILIAPLRLQYDRMIAPTHLLLQPDNDRTDTPAIYERDNDCTNTPAILIMVMPISLQPKYDQVELCSLEYNPVASTVLLV